MLITSLIITNPRILYICYLLSLLLFITIPEIVINLHFDLSH